MRVSWSECTPLKPVSDNLVVFDDCSGQPVQIWWRTGTLKRAKQSFLISKIVLDGSKFIVTSLFSLVYRMRSWYVVKGSADTMTTSGSDKLIGVRSVRNTLISFAIFSVFKTVDSIWASLCVAVGQPLICWRQTGNDVRREMMSLRSSKNTREMTCWFKLKAKAMFTDRPETGDKNLVAFVVEMHVEN